LKIPPITVVIPATGGGPGLLRAIESVHAQTRPPRGLLVVDDGLTDADIRGTLYGLGAVIVDGPRAGVAGARNAGLHAAGTDWVALLDCDDHWGRRHLELAGLQIASQPEAGACFGGALHVSDEGRQLARFSPSKRHATLEGLLTRRLRPTTSATLVNRRVALAVGGFYSGFRRPAGVEDTDLWWRVASERPCLVQAEPEARYVVHRARDRTRTWSELDDLSSDWGLCIERLSGSVSEGLRRRAAAQYRALMARYWYLAGFGAQGRSEAARSLRWHPSVAGVSAMAMGLLPPPARRLAREGVRQIRRSGG
jgi:glycosyltransferase involved in cell wall biosynthesis